MFIFHGLPHIATGDSSVIKADSGDRTRFPDHIYVKFLLFTKWHEYERALPRIIIRNFRLVKIDTVGFTLAFYMDPPKIMSVFSKKKKKNSRITYYHIIS